MKKILVAVSALILLVTVAIFVYVRRRNAPKPTDRSFVGQVVTLAGSGAPGFEDGPAAGSSFADPFGIAVDDHGDLIVADGGHNNLIRRVTRAGTVETVAGGAEGYLDGPASSAAFNTPSGIALTRNRETIVADTSNNRIRRISRDGVVTTVAGNGEHGCQDGPGASASFDGPIGVAVDSLGNIFVADSYNDCVRRITSDGEVTTLAGSRLPGFKDGEPASSQFDTPCGVAVDARGNLFVADTGNNAVRQISANGQVSTIAGGVRGEEDGQGTDARFDHPVAIAVTHDGFLFVADESSGRIRLITPERLVRTVAGDRSGFGNGVGPLARFNRPSGIAVDRTGTLYVADGDNYLIRKVSAAPPADSGPQTALDEVKLIQPSPDASASSQDVLIPRLDINRLAIGQSFPWPLYPQNHWHEIAGVVGEARGAPGGVALDHLHSGLDVHGKMGEEALSVLDDKVTSPLSNWGFDESGEGIHLGFMSYIHVRIARSAGAAVTNDDRFKARLDDAGNLAGVRVRRGARFRVGDVIGTLNQLNHVHMNLGPWNAQANPIQFPFVDFKDTVSPTIEPNGIEIWDAAGRPFAERRQGRLMIWGDVSIVVAVYDRVDGNAAGRKLGIYRIGYQLLNESGEPAPGFEAPIFNIVFDRLPAADRAVFLAYAPGSGISAYGTPTKFRYIITDVVSHGQARPGALRTSTFAPGNYRLRILAEDFAGNRASGKNAELPIAIER